MTVKPRVMVPSLKILAVKVQFARNEEAKMLPTLLKCFPSLESAYHGNGLDVSSIYTDH
jgi:hypothetical protein